MVILLSGCVSKETSVPEKATPNTTFQTPVYQTPVPTDQIPAEQGSIYQIQVTEVKSLQDCIVSSGSKPCSFINLEVKNNDKNSADIKIIKDLIITKDGKQLGKRYDREVGLSNLCVRQSGMEFMLNASENKNIGLCYPLINKNDNPLLSVTATINGERKEYSFDLIKYGLSN